MEGFFSCTPKGQLQRFTLVHACHTLCLLSAFAGYNGSWPKTAINLPLGRKPLLGFSPITKGEKHEPKKVKSAGGPTTKDPG